MAKKKRLITSANLKCKKANIKIMEVCRNDGFAPSNTYNWLAGRNLPKPSELRRFINSLNARGAAVRFDDFYSYEYYE